jgi:hypothetical protein
MEEQTEAAEAPAVASTTANITSTLIVLGGVAALLAYQFLVRRDEGERTVRIHLANQ